MKVLYFAWLKTKVGLSEEDVSPPRDVETVADLIVWLRDRSDGHGAAFQSLSAVRVAVNQEHVYLDAPVSNADEVAFFPPVTGG